MWLEMNFRNIHGGQPQLSSLLVKDAFPRAAEALHSSGHTGALLCGADGERVSMGTSGLLQAGAFSVQPLLSLHTEILLNRFGICLISLFP